MHHDRPEARALFRVAIGAVVFALGCGSSGTDGAGGVGGVGSTGSSVGKTSGSTQSSATTMPGACDTDPLRTGLVAQQTGVSVDSFDCQILTESAQYAEPDPMIFKAIIYVESRFDNASAACPNLPCGTPNGWTAAESGCYGLMQIVPACGGKLNAPGLLPNGHPNLTTDMAASTWSGSVFNPSVNIGIGISGFADNRAQVKAQFPGCTEEQYTLMAMGNYNSYGSTKSCTVYNQSYDDLVLMAYQQYAAAAKYPPHPY